MDIRLINVFCLFVYNFGMFDKFQYIYVFINEFFWGNWKYNRKYLKYLKLFGNKYIMFVFFILSLIFLVLLCFLYHLGPFTCSISLLSSFSFLNYLAQVPLTVNILDTTVYSINYFNIFISLTMRSNPTMTIFDLTFRGRHLITSKLFTN